MPDEKPFFAVSDNPPGMYDESGASIVNVDDYPKYEIADGLVFCPVFAGNVSLNFVTFPAGSGFPSHVHPEEQISIIQEGEMEFTIGEATRMVRPGDVIILPPHVPHSGRTFDGACRVLDIYSPPRHGTKDLIANASPLNPGETDDRWPSGGPEPA